MEHPTADVSTSPETLPSQASPAAAAVPDLDRALARAIRRLIVVAEHREPRES
jgi:hypothetical protein